MYESEDSKQSQQKRSQKERTAIACDRCRLKKQRCDGLKRQPNSCTNCKGHEECRYTGVTAKSKHVSRSYLQELHNKLNFYTDFIAVLAPGYDVEAEYRNYLEGDKPSYKRKHEESEDFRDTQSFPSFESSDTDKHSEDTFGSAKVMLKEISKYAGSPITGTDKQRPEYWQNPNFDDLVNSRCPPYIYEDFGGKEVVQSLVDKYFEKVNTTFPILVKPTFTKDIDSRMLERKYACILILVLALGSLYSDDLPNNGCHRFLSGNNYLQIYMRKAPDYSLISPEIEDVQALVRSAQFRASWVVNGQALVTATELELIRPQGMLLNQVRGDEIRHECRKRVMWSIYVLDRALSGAYGRQPLLKDEDIRTDVPRVMECEANKDEHLSINYINATIKLYRLQGQIMQEIYTMRNIIDRDSVPIKKTVASIYSNLNQWLEGLDSSLQYDSECTHNVRYEMMCNLKLMYYNTQIFLYRNFIVNPTESNPSIFNTQCLTICVNCARSILAILNTMEFERCLIQSYVDVTLNLATPKPFNAMIVLIFSVCESKRLGQETHSEMDYITKGIKILERRQIRDIVAGKALDIVKNVLRACQLSICEDIIHTDTPDIFKSGMERSDVISHMDDGSSNDFDAIRWMQFDTNSSETLDDFLNSFSGFAGIDQHDMEFNSPMEEGTVSSPYNQSNQRHRDVISDFLSSIF
ncbi:hypothetical protein E3Q02_04197 [Wallemia mellicola]|uniref:Zn(2)-C6 fungal-type domain-containing protein n=1 Tax=Wallemia mellicola TaxID=1708541 RepID=A0AB38MQI4_9BASI|nr:hypothetical protein E3Q02_04197 [Wallemia mellicola]